MNNLNFVLKFTLILLLILSCTKSQTDLVDIDSRKIDNQSNYLIDLKFENSSKLSVQKLNESLENFKKNILILGERTIPSPNNFMFEKPISFNHNGIEMILVNQKVSANNGKTNYGLTFLNHEFGFDNFFIVKTINHSDTKKDIHFLSPKTGKLLISTSIDAKAKSISVESHTQTNNINSKQSPDYDCEATWGQNTATCLEDVYTNYGWVSVWATVQSAFIPQTAAALAAACAIDAYNPYDGGGCYTSGGNNDEDHDGLPIPGPR